MRSSTAGTEIERSVRDEISLARGNDKKKTKAGRELVLRQRRNSERMKRRREKKEWRENHGKGRNWDSGRR
jgi:hypothetical protein